MGDNWIHMKPATGMHTVNRGVQMLMCTQSRWQECTNVHTHTQTKRFACPYIFTHTNWWKGLGQGWGRQLSHASLSANSVPHSTETTSGMCVCMFARESVNKSGWKTHRETESEREKCVPMCVSTYVCQFERCTKCVKFGFTVLTVCFCKACMHAHMHACVWGFINRVANCEKVNTDVGACPGSLTQLVQPFRLEECQQAGTLSFPFTPTVTHPDTIPVMQMQTCMIFAQIPLKASSQPLWLQ